MTYRMKFAALTCVALASTAIVPSAAAYDGETRLSAKASLSATGAAETVSSKTYDVTVKGDTNDSRAEVFDKALYKAARKTLDKDYEWFRVLERDTETEVRSDDDDFSRLRVERYPVRSCGLLGCTTSYETRYRTDTRFEWPDREEVRHEVEIEYEMGLGTPSDTRNVYDARIIKNSYR